LRRIEFVGDSDSNGFGVLGPVCRCSHLSKARMLVAPAFAARLSQMAQERHDISSTRRGAEIVGQLAKH
jgi:hypothetical protein